MNNKNTPNDLAKVARKHFKQNSLDRREIGDATKKKMLQACEREFDVIMFEWITGKSAKSEAERLGVSLNLSIDLSGGLL